MAAPLEHLPVGTAIRTADQKTYVITSYIGRGGTSFVYSASRGGADAFVLKEACPYDDRGLVRRDLVIVPDDDEAALRLSDCRIIALSEKNIGEEIRVPSSRAVVLWDDLLVDSITAPDGTSAPRREGEACGPGGSVFSILQNINGWGSFLSQMIQSRRDANTSFSIWEIAQIGQKILEALAALHEKGFVHCDLAPGNLHFERAANPAMESIGEAFITDFGSAKRIDPETGRTPPADRIFSSRRFLAPEMCVRGATLTQKADVFAVGLLLLELMDVLPPEQTPRMYDLADEDRLRWHGATPRAARAGMALLRGCLQDEEALRFTPKEALAAANALYRAARPPEYRLVNENLGMVSGLYETVLRNRSEELRRLDRELERDGAAYLYGMGGIGKTSLALTYAKSRFPNRAFRITYQGNLRKTIAELEFSGFDETGLDAEQRYQKKLELLGSQYPSKDCLMVLDNFDSPGETLFDLKDKTFSEVMALPMRILITTRSDPDTAQPTPELLAPSEDAMTAYFQQMVGREMEARELRQVRELVHLVQAHPMTVEIAARCVRARFRSVSVANLLEAFRENLKEAKLPGVRLEKDGAPQNKRTPYEHLKLLFDLTNLTEAERTVLCHAALLPEDGMDQALFFRCEGEDEQEALEFLAERSMLQYGEDDRLRIHPLVREIVRGELEPKKADCDPFLGRLWKTFDELNLQRIPLYRQMIPAFVCAHQMFADADQNADCAYRAAYLMLFCKEKPDEARALAEFVIDQRERHTDYAETAAGYRIWCVVTLPRIHPVWVRNLALQAQYFDCRGETIDLDALTQDYDLLRITSDPGSGEAYDAAKAALIVSAVALYRAIPELREKLTAQNQLKQIVQQLKLIAADVAEKWPDQSKRDEAEQACLAKLMLGEDPPLLPACTDTHNSGKTSPFSVSSYLQILNCISKPVRDEKAAQKLHVFLSMLRRYCIQPEQLTGLSVSRKGQILSRIVKTRQAALPEYPCVEELIEIADIWRSLAESTEALQARKKRLEKSRDCAQQALEEARTKSPEKPDAGIGPLVILADVLLELCQFERIVTEDPIEAEKRKRKAFRYAEEAIQLSRRLPHESPQVLQMEKDLRRIDGWSCPPESHRPARPEGESVKKMFDRTAVGREWLHEQEKRERQATQLFVLKQYEVAIAGWFTKGSEKTFAEDWQWLDEQEWMINARPGEALLLPYHIDLCEGKRVITNAIRCSFCGELLKSEGRYDTHQRRVCTCGRCGIDGGNDMLIRFSMTPDADAFADLSIVEDSHEDDRESDSHTAPNPRALVHTEHRILVNAIRCRLCGELVVSAHHYDLRFCRCKKCAVDGGTEFPRLLGDRSDYEELSCWYTPDAPAAERRRELLRAKEILECEIGNIKREGFGYTRLYHLTTALDSVNDLLRKMENQS